MWDTLGSAGTWHGGHREGVASTLEQTETNQVCEVLEGDFTSSEVGPVPPCTTL